MMSLGPKRSRRSSASAEVRPRSPGKRPASRSTGSGRSIMEAAASFHFGLSDGARPVSVRLRGASRQWQDMCQRVRETPKTSTRQCLCERGPGTSPPSPHCMANAYHPGGASFRSVWPYDTNQSKSIGMRAHPHIPPTLLHLTRYSQLDPVLRGLSILPGRQTMNESRTMNGSRRARVAYEASLAQRSAL